MLPVRSIPEESRTVDGVSPVVCAKSYAYHYRKETSVPEYPPGYEVEPPVDLSRPVIVAAKDSEPEPMPSGLIAVANPKPGTGKSVTARRLHATLADRSEDVMLWSCAPHNRLPPWTPDHSLVIADTGSEPRGAWRYPAQSADLLVVPVPEEEEAANAAKWMLDQLAADGRFRLVMTAVTAVIRAEHGRDRGLARRIRRYFGERTGQVVDLRWTGPPGETRPWQMLGDIVLNQLTATDLPPAPRATPRPILQPRSLFRKATS